MTLERFDPILRAAFESVRVPPRIEIWPRLPADINGCATDERILLRVDHGPYFEETLCHELVHWHLEERWNRLPLPLEEGLAYLLDDMLFMGAGSLATIPGPKQEVLDRALSVRSCLELPTDDRQAHLESLVWAAGSIGIEGLERMCDSAASAGLAILPPEWIRLELPPLTRSLWYGPGWLNGQGAEIRLD